MDDHRQKAERLRALWKSGRDKYASFFSILNEVRAEIGDEALPTWCFDELRIGISVIVEARRLLTAMDAEIVKADLAEAKKAEREQREADAAEKRAAREKAQRQREIEEAEHAVRLAALNTKTTKETVKQRRMESKEQKRQEAGADTVSSGKELAQARGRTILQRSEGEDPSKVCLGIKQALKECQKGNDLWIEGSITAAELLLRLRGLYPADRDFGEALTSNGVDINSADRAALIGLAKLGRDEMRRIFRSNDSRSYQVLWRDNKPTLKVV